MLEVQIKHETDEGEEITVFVEGDVTKERDPCGTGDSPTEYEVFIKRCTDMSGNPVILSAYEDKQATRLLIEEFTS